VRYLTVRGTVDGKNYEQWLERKTEILNFLEKVNQNRQAGKYLSREILEKAVELKKEYKKVERITRCWTDTLEFMYEYFSTDSNPEGPANIVPANFPIEDAPDFHRELCGMLDSLLVDPTQKISWSVPRGHAKSTILSNVTPVKNIVYNLRHYIIILSETDQGSRMFTEWVNSQLKYNAKLRADFGELLDPNSKANAKDNSEVFVTKNNIKVQGASLQKQLRGSKHLNWRPDLIIADDLESAKNTNTPELRAKNLHQFNSVVMPMGDPTSTAFLYLGTLVHPQGLLPAVMERADFKSKRYSAIISPPERVDLWERYEEIYRDLENSNRKEEAETFYFENQEEMDKGVQTLWSDRFPYYQLIQTKHDIGTKAFNSEMLNIPYSDEDAIFQESMFQFFDDKDLFDQFGRPLPLEKYGFWDIAITGKGDYQCIVTLGRDRRTGIFYVLDCWLKKVNMHEGLEMAVKKIIEHEHHTFGVETVQAQWSAYQQLRQRLAAIGYYKTRVKSVRPTTKKEVRIESLEPLVEQGAIRFKKNQRLLLEMFMLFPTHDNDDGPDAIHGAVEIAGNRQKKMFLNKPTGW
jgi:predicted phage terminase large subunit-like protein